MCPSRWIASLPHRIHCMVRPFLEKKATNIPAHLAASKPSPAPPLRGQNHGHGYSAVYAPRHVIALATTMCGTRIGATGCSAALPRFPCQRSAVSIPPYLKHIRTLLDAPQCVQCARTIGEEIPCGPPDTCVACRFCSTPAIIVQVSTHSKLVRMQPGKQNQGVFASGVY